MHRALPAADAGADAEQRVRPATLPSARSMIAVAGSEVGLPGAAARGGRLAAWEQVIERGYGGYVAKDQASVYEGGPAERSLKVKMPCWTVVEDRWHRRINMTERRRQ